MLFFLTLLSLAAAVQFLAHRLRRAGAQPDVCTAFSTVACILSVAAILAAVDLARAGEIAGPAALAPMPAAPFVRPWWLDALASVLPELIQAAVIGVMVLWGLAIKWAANLKRLQGDAATRAYLLDGGQRAMALAYKVAGVPPGESLSEAQLTRILTTGAAYMAQRFPDGLKRLGIDTDTDLRGLIEGVQADYEGRARRGSASGRGIRPLSIDEMIATAPPRGSRPDVTSVYRPEDGPRAGSAADER